MNRPYIIAIAGGSGSGKTTFARRLYELLGESEAVCLGQDSYYIDQSQHFDGDGGKVNFDHPDALDFPLLKTHLEMLRRGESIEVPIYDFATHKRIEKTQTIHPHKIIIVDGILLLSIDYLRPLFDRCVFMDTDEELRFERRLKRDVAERGRTGIGVYRQFFKQVKPMHDQFVEPFKKSADLLVTPENFIKELNLEPQRIKVSMEASIQG